jgi:hypothetical protein
VHKVSRTVIDIVQNSTLSKEQQGKMAFAVGFEVMEYFDQHILYLNEEIMVHCGATFVSVVDIIEVEKGDEKEEEINRFQKKIAEAEKMIKAESGIERLNKLFKSITKAKHKSPVIDYYNFIKNKMK